MMPKPTSLRRALLWQVFPAIIVFLLAQTALTYVLALRFINQVHDHWLFDTARSLAKEMDELPERGQLVINEAVHEVVSWDTIDHIYYRVDTEHYGSVGHELPLPESGAASDEPVYYDARFQGHRVRVVMLTDAHLVPGDLLRVRVAETLKKRDRVALDLMTFVIVSELMLLLIIGGLIYAAVRRGLLPLERLAFSVRARDPDDLSPLAEQEAPQEIIPLTQALNHMMHHLRGRIQGQQRFIADASHQLRTPLAALKVLLEAMERSLRLGDSNTLASDLRHSLRALNRTIRMSNQLLLLARAEQRNRPADHFEELNLRELAFAAGSQWIASARKQGIDLGFEADDGAIVLRGDPVLLTELIHNLIDNALHYAGKQAHVTLKVTAGPPVQLSVEDDGPGVAELERERIFQRFYRVPGHLTEGSGLGLSIVREIAQTHGGDVWLENPEPGGARFVVRFGA